MHSWHTSIVHETHTKRIISLCLRQLVTSLADGGVAIGGDVEATLFDDVPMGEMQRMTSTQWSLVAGFIEWLCRQAWHSTSEQSMQRLLAMAGQ